MKKILPLLTIPILLSSCSMVKSSYNYNKGTECLKTQDYNGALPFLREAVRLDPSDNRNHIQLASAYFNIGDEDRAWLHLRQAVRIPPYNEEAEVSFVAICKYFDEKYCLSQGGQTLEQIRDTLGVEDEDVFVDSQNMWLIYGNKILKFKDGVLLADDGTKCNVIKGYIIKPNPEKGLQKDSKLAVDYKQTLKLATTPKSLESVEFFEEEPKRASFDLGVIGVRGNPYSNLQDLTLAAKEKGALIGVDYLILKEKGTDCNVVVTSTKSESYVIPWAIFSARVYQPSISGISYDAEGFITGFDLEGKAESAGLRLQDQVIEVDGIKFSNENYVQHLNTIKPGDKNTYTVLRDGEKLNFVIIAMPN